MLGENGSVSQRSYHAKPQPGKLAAQSRQVAVAEINENRSEAKRRERRKWRMAADKKWHIS
jgi:hypothetical protein